MNWFRIAVLALMPGMRVHAQTTVPRMTYGVSAGVAIQSDSRGAYMSRVGPLASVHGQWRASSRLGGMLQLSAARFAPNTENIYLDCPKPGGFGFCGPAIPERSLAVAGATGSLVLFDDAKARTGRGAHYAIGIAVMREVRAPNGSNRNAAGWSAGIGYDLRLAGITATLDARYEQFAHLTQHNWHMVPISIGVTW